MIKAIFSIFLVYHLIAILSMPLLGSILGRRIGQFITPYTNITGLNPTWEFFSPDPPVPLYFEYIVYFEDDHGEELSPPIEGLFPEDGLEPTNNPNKIRLKTSVRLLALNEGKADTVFMGYLCRKYPRASRVFVKPIVEWIPPLEKVQLNDGVVETTPVTTLPMNRNCNEAYDEEQG